MQKKCLIRSLKILIALIVIVGVSWGLYDSWDKIKEIRWEPNYFLLILAGICYAVAYIPAAVYWRYAMQTLGQQPGVYETFRAYYIGHLGKYVPGKAMVLVLRSGLLSRERTKLPVTAASVFLETMTMMAVGAFVAALIAVLWFQQIGHGMQVPNSNKMLLLALGVMCGTMLPILPPVFHFVAKKCRIELEGLRFRTIAVGWALNIPVWFMLGLGFWLTMLGLGVQSNGVFHDVLYCTLVVSMAVVLGFATPIPGGLGAREAAMVLFLVPFFTAHPGMIGETDPTGMAIVIAAVQRFISILSELTASAMLVRKVSTGK